MHSAGRPKVEKVVTAPPRSSTRGHDHERVPSHHRNARPRPDDGAGGPGPAAQASGSGATGTTSLASVLTADGNQFDRDWYDYDIVTEAVLAVIAADADANSPVRLLTDGSVPLTAFIPNDRAFQVLVKDLTGQWVQTESEVFAAVAGLGIDTVEDVLLYHVVPGATITARDALRSGGAQLTTAAGPHHRGQARRAGSCRSSSCVTRTPTTSTRS